MNSVQLVGRLTGDPDTRKLDDGQVTTIRLAVDRPDDTADFFSIVSFGPLAVTVADHLTKGRLVAVVGRLRHHEWKTDDDQVRSRVDITAQSISFLDSKPDTDTTNRNGDRDTRPPQPARRDSWNGRQNANRPGR